MKTRLVIATAAGVMLLGGLAGAGALATQRGWQPPSWLSFLNIAGGQTQAVDVGLFCHEHGVPEKFCTLCHAELKGKLLMCPEHGLPEEICTLCHPENEQRYGLKMICPEHGVPEPFCVECHPALAAGEVESDWCTAHGVPESLCTICNPELSKTLAMCPEHGVPEALCTICQPELAANFTICRVHRLPVGFCPEGSDCRVAGASACADGRCNLPGELCPAGTCTVSADGSGNGTLIKATLPRVRFAAAGIGNAIGLATAPVTPFSAAPTIRANAEVGYDETRLVHVLPRVPGIVHEVRVALGEVVAAGDVLAVVDSADLGQAKADYLATQAMVDLAQKNMDRLRDVKAGAIAGKYLLEVEAESGRSEAELLKVRQKLLNFGLTSEEMAALGAEPEQDRNLLRIMAPQQGTIVEREAVTGEAVQSTTSMLTIADLSSVWVHMDVYESDLPRVSVGRPIVLRIPGLAPLEFAGTVSWIDSRVDHKTRTIHVHAVIENERRLLRANMFGQAEIQVGDARSSLTVPAEALQWDGGSYIVFVRKEDDLFEPHRVLRGRDHGKRVELAWTDLQAGAPVVTTGSFLLKTEIMKGAIGAGCCGE